jgi:hypothetical protein
LQFYSTVLQHYNFYFGEVSWPTYMLGTYMQKNNNSLQVKPLTHIQKKEKRKKERDENTRREFI